MPTKKNIQAEKDFVFRMSLLMSIMKSIALSQFVSFKKSRGGRFKDFSSYFERFFHLMDLTKSRNPFVRQMSPVLGIVIVCGEGAMLSGLNARLIRTALDISEEGQPCFYMVTGTKGVARLKMENKNYQAFPAVSMANLDESAGRVKDYIFQQVKENKLGKVIMIYAEFVSMAQQRPKVMTLLPMNELYSQKLNEGVDPTDKIHQESSIESLSENLCDLWITNRVLYAFQESKLSEVAFQANQLEGGIQNLELMKRTIKLSLCKKTREVTDNGLREIVSAMIACIAKD